MSGNPAATAVGADPPRRGAQRTRSMAALVQAAIEVFGESGFSDATISDISARAGLSHGSFYTYFDSKEAVLRSAINEILHRDRASGEQPDVNGSRAIRDRIEATNRRFFDTYERNARLLASFEELASRDEITADLRRQTRYSYIHRTIGAIRHWQEQGRVDADLDAEAIAHCLGAMVERVAHMQVLFGDGCGADRMIDAISHVWMATLGLDGEDGPATDAVRATRQHRSAEDEPVADR